MTRLQLPSYLLAVRDVREARALYWFISRAGGFAQESDNRIEIVDWKTDRIPSDQVPDRLRDYELQAGLYVLGLEAAMGRSVKRVT